ncbi:MAG: hypothetical protein ABIZ80_17730 [Bryobacteraceae bacterium]
MKTATVLFAGVMIASMALGQAGDPFAEERYHRKYGRYTPAEEARRKAAKDETKYVGQACCRNMAHEALAGQVAMTSSGTEAYFRAKYGRAAPAAQARQKATDEQTATHIGKCAELGRCALVAAETASTNLSAANLSETEARFRAKYGWSAPNKTPPASNPPTQHQSLLAANDHVPCEEACCKQSE